MENSTEELMQNYQQELYIYIIHRLQPNKFHINKGIGIFVEVEMCGMI